MAFPRNHSQAFVPLITSGRKRRPRADALPDGINFIDTGCQYHDHCLTCPFERCRFDLHRGIASIRIPERRAQVVKLRLEGASAQEISEQMGLSKRQVWRYLQVARKQDGVRFDDVPVRASDVLVHHRERGGDDAQRPAPLVEPVTTKPPVDPAMGRVVWVSITRVASSAKQRYHTVKTCWMKKANRRIPTMESFALEAGCIPCQTCCSH